jgi:hypothetical protein
VGCSNYIANYRASCVSDNSNGWRSVSDDFPTRSRYKFERPATQQQSMYDVCVSVSEDLLKVSSCNHLKPRRINALTPELLEKVML